MILIALAVLGLVSVPLMGGSLGALAKLDLRWLWTAPVALALQVVIVTIAPGGDPTLHEAVHIGTYGLLGIFLLANRRLPGVRLIGAGTLTNAIAIVANGGVMPVAATAHRLAGLSTGTGFQNSAVLSHPHLLWLGDIIPIPAPYGLHNVLSLGDCAIFAGMFVLLHRTCRRPGHSQLRLRLRRPESVDGDRVRSTDAVLTAALTSFHATLALWQAGEPAQTPLARLTLDNFEASRTAVAQLPARDAALDRARAAMNRLSRALETWQAVPVLSQKQERSLLSAERMLTAARAEFLLARATGCSRVLKQAEHVAIGVGHARHQAPATNVAHGLIDGGTGSGHLGQLRLDVGHVPVGHRRAHALRPTARH